ncbi:unknown [Prevotella sp. CAG:487]|nr:unknown [Prevotella sp. CAG:487]
MLFPPFHLISGIRLQTDYTPEKPISSQRKAFSACPYSLSRYTGKAFSHDMKNSRRISISQSPDIQQIIMTRKNQPIQRQYVFRLSLRNSQRLYII